MSHLRRASLITLAAAAVLAAPASAALHPGANGLSSRLDELATGPLAAATPGQQAGAVSLPDQGPGSLLRDGGSLIVQVRVAGNTSDRVSGVQSAGAEVLHVSSEYRTITASVPEQRLQDVADTPGVDSVIEVLTPMTGSVGAAGGSADGSTGVINTCATGVVSEGDTQLQSGAARTQFDVDGTGVKVGVLSDSYDRKATASKHAADDIASGDLPGPGNPCGRTTPVQVLDDSAPEEVPPPTVSDEGRAMIQIVHDVAPGAGLAFATAFTGDLEFADNIRALATAGASVIVDDIIYFNEPFYQDSVIAAGVRDVTAQGVAYFSMAFNNNRVIAGNDSNSWEAPAYRPTTCPALVAALTGPDNCMDFDPGAGFDNTFQVTSPSGRTPRIDLQWAEPWFGVTTDFDLYVINNTTNTIVATSDDNNTGTTLIPFELAAFTSNNSTADNYQIVIHRFSGTGTPRIKFVNSDNGAQSITSLNYPVSAGGDIVGPTIFGHNGTATAQTVAAVPFNNSATPEAFSSRGPVTHLFGPVSGLTPAAPLAVPEVLNKPDVAASDGGITTFFGGSNRFFGTSAAAPHAAAVGALQLSANPALTQAQVKAAQVATADPVGAFGQLAVGAGLVNAIDAIAASPTAPPTVAIDVPPAPLSSQRRPSLSFSTTGRVSSLTCTIDTIVYECASPFTAPAKLGNGDHSVAVTVADLYGQTAVASAPFRIDLKGPKVVISKGPKAKTKKKKAKFKFSAERGAKFECKLDEEKFSKCSSPAKFKVDTGKHELQIQATDRLGNTGKSESYGWKYKKK